MRKRKLPLETVVKLLHTMTGGSLNRELSNSGSASAFSQRRDKIPSVVFEDTFCAFNQAHPDRGTYKGYAIYSVDGTVVNCPKNEKSPTYTWDGQSGCSAYHVTTLYNIIDKTYYSAVISPQSRQDEIRDLLFQLTWYGFDRPSILLGDRLFCTYNTLQEVISAGAIHYPLERCRFSVGNVSDKGVCKSAPKSGI